MNTIDVLIVPQLTLTAINVSWKCQRILESPTAQAVLKGSTPQKINLSVSPMTVKQQLLSNQVTEQPALLNVCSVKLLMMDTANLVRLRTVTLATLLGANLPSVLTVMKLLISYLTTKMNV
jgi:hypothetical protein